GPIVVPRRAPALRRDAQPQPAERAIRETRAEARMIERDATAGAVAARLRGGRADVAGGLFAAALLSALLASLVILIVLLWDVFRRGVPLLADRGTDFLAAGPSSLPADAGIGAALAGSIVMMG